MADEAKKIVWRERGEASNRRGGGASVFGVFPASPDPRSAGVFGVPGRDFVWSHDNFSYAAMPLKVVQ